MSFTKPQIYDIAKEEESINLIKIQNKKIAELFEVVESKNKTIEDMEKEIYRLRKCISIADNYERHITILEGKIFSLEETIKEKDTINANNATHISKIEENEKTTATELGLKENYIQDLLDIIKQYENKHDDLCKVNEDQGKKLLVLQNKLSINENSYQKLQAELQNKITQIEQMTANDQIFKGKAQELVKIIAEQDEEMKAYQEKEGANEMQLSVAKTQNMTLKVNIDELSHVNSEIMKKVTQLEEKVKSAENTINDLNNIIYNERTKNYDQTANLQNMSNEYILLKNKYNDLEQVKIEIQSKDQEILGLKSQIAKLNETLAKKDKYIQSSDKELSALLNDMTIFASTALKWVDTYIGNHVDITTSLSYIQNANYEIPKIEFVFASTKFDAIEHIISNTKLLHIFQQLADMLSNTRERVNQEFERYETLLVHIQKENTELAHINESLKCEITSYKDDKTNTLKLIEDNFKESSILKKDIQQYKEMYELLEKNKQEYDHEMQNLCEFFYGETNTNNGFTFVKNNKLNFLKIKEIASKAFEMINTLTKENELKEKRINELSIIKSECDGFRIELSEIKKSFTHEKALMSKEREEMTHDLEKKKIIEVKAVEERYKAQIEEMTRSLQEKEEELEKLNNDNNLLYSQYLLSEKNIENYKINRKEYDDQQQIKIEELNQIISQHEKENSKLKSELDLLYIKLQGSEQCIRTKLKENDDLKKKMTDDAQLENILDQYESRLKLAHAEIKVKDMNIKRLVEEMNQTGTQKIN